MSRAISGFIVFCLLLTAAVGALVWWVGPNLLSLAFDRQSARTPYFVVFLRRSDPTGYAQAFTRLYASGGLESEPAGKLYWHQNNLALISGKRADEWEYLDVVRFETGRDFVRLATSVEHRDLAGLLDDRVIFGTKTPPAVLQPRPLQLWLLAREPQAGALEQWSAGPAEAGVRIVWDAPVTVLEGAAGTHEDWDRLLVLDIADSQAGLSWLGSPEAQTALSLLSSLTSAVNLWMLRPPPVEIVE